MEQFEIQARAAELEQQIAKLPAGSITKKIVNGKAYFYTPLDGEQETAGEVYSYG